MLTRYVTLFDVIDYSCLDVLITTALGKLTTAPIKLLVHIFIQ